VDLEWEIWEASTGRRTPSMVSLASKRKCMIDNKAVEVDGAPILVAEGIVSTERSNRVASMERSRAASATERGWRGRAAMPMVRIPLQIHII